MKALLVLSLLLFGGSLMAEDHQLKASSYDVIRSEIGKGRPFLLEIGSESCHSCQVMGKLLYEVTQKHPTYNIHFIDVRKERKAAYALKVQMIPTQIIYDKKGKEVYRHMGVLTPNALKKLFSEHGFR